MGKKQHKKKIKGTELDGLIKKMSKMSTIVVSAKIAERERIEKEQDAIVKTIKTEEDFKIKLAIKCEARNEALCGSTNCTCRMGLCPIVNRNKK